MSLNKILTCVKYYMHEIVSVVVLFAKDSKFSLIRRIVASIGGYILFQVYYYVLWKKIPFPGDIGNDVGLILSIVLAIGNAVTIQMRCICMLLLPMYCGKPGRGVLKALVLTYVVAGPITNMGLNAGEVVRVFACSTELPFNISKEKHSLLSEPITACLVDFSRSVNEVKYALGSLGDITAPIQLEVESTKSLTAMRDRADKIDNILNTTRRSDAIERKYSKHSEDVWKQKYMKKIEYRCEDIFSRGMLVCNDMFSIAHSKCQYAIPRFAADVICGPLSQVCKFVYVMKTGVCEIKYKIHPGIGQGYAYLKKAKDDLVASAKSLQVVYKIGKIIQLYDIQDARETGQIVMHAFEEKLLIMHYAVIIMNICIALLFLRIVCAAITYHDLYLTNIDYDNIYITSYFKDIDLKRQRKVKLHLLPLKKMERSKYIDINSTTVMMSDRQKLLVHLLKVMLEVVTATTFVMLDRLFYEALYVVRQHAQVDFRQQAANQLKIEVAGSGLLANLIRKFLGSLHQQSPGNFTVTNEPCLPQPRHMPVNFYLRIYGGYLWIILLLSINTYTTRLKALICGYFYPVREKHRILHLYNDILKKRMKMSKTLRKRAVRAVRAHYLSGETLLSTRMRFPKLLDWLEILPAARMKCTICGETQPRNAGPEWHRCETPHCPFVWCNECWEEAGTCLACDAKLIDLTDIESLSADDLPRY